MLNGGAVVNCRRVLERFERFLPDRSGATAIEYGLILAGIAVFIMVAVFAMGDELTNLFHAVQTKLANSYT